MKKNNVMRIASALLVAVLLTTCAISGTFAKYTTSFSGNSAARVAKWGFTDPGEVTFDLFKDTYNDGAIASQETDAQGNKVNVIAPGASGEFSITLMAAEDVEKTEVAYEFKVTLETSADTDSDLLDKIVWTFNGEEDLTFADLKEKVEQYNGEYEPGEAPDVEEMNISWEWVFEVDSATNDDDTKLGQDGEAKVSITFTFSATQIGGNETTTEAAGE